MTDHAFIGPLGALVPFGCPSDLAVTTVRPMSSRTSALGVVREQQAPRTTRSWRVGLGVATPDEVADLAALVEGEYGPGPFWFVEPWATVTNLLSPRASTLADRTFSNTATRGGVIVMADGSRARTILPTATTFFPYRPNPVNETAVTRDDIPVVQGRHVTGSAWVAGSGLLQLRWAGADGTIVGQVDTPYTVAGAPQRVAATGLPPADAVSCYLAVTGATVVARPAVTWTTGVVDWHTGQGAPRVNVTGFDQDVLMAVADPAHRQRLVAASFVVREVGV